MERMLSSKKSKEVWMVIHRILHPSPQRITVQPDKLNNFFASTAERTIGINVHHVDDYASIIKLIQSLPANIDNGFQIRTVTLKEVIHELRNIRSDSSTLPDNIPANMIKMVADYLGLHLVMSSTPASRICTFLPLGNSRASARFLKGTKSNPRNTYDLYQYYQCFQRFMND